MELSIPVYFYTEETKKKNELDMDYSVMAEDKTMEMTFYNIDCIAPYEDVSGKMGGVVNSGGEIYITPLTYQELKELISIERQKIYVHLQ